MEGCCSLEGLSSSGAGNLSRKPPRATALVSFISSWACQLLALILGLGQIPPSAASLVHQTGFSSGARRSVGVPRASVSGVRRSCSLCGSTRRASGKESGWVRPQTCCSWSVCSLPPPAWGTLTCEHCLRGLLEPHWKLEQICQKVDLHAPGPRPPFHPGLELGRLIFWIVQQEKVLSIICWP